MPRKAPIPAKKRAAKVKKRNCMVNIGSQKGIAYARYVGARCPTGTKAIGDRTAKKKIRIHKKMTGTTWDETMRDYLKEEGLYKKRGSSGPRKKRVHQPNYRKAQKQAEKIFKKYGRL